MANHTSSKLNRSKKERYEYLMQFWTTRLLIQFCTTELFVKKERQNSLSNLQTNLTNLQKFFLEKCLKSVPTYSDKQAFPVQKIMPR